MKSWPVADLVAECHYLLGPKLLGDIVDVAKFAEIDDWEEGKAHPSPVQVERLRRTMAVVELFPPGLRQLRRWMSQPNERLGGRSPAAVLHDEESEEVLSLAREHVATLSE